MDFFSSNPESAKESQDDFAPTEERFTDEFFRLERIGVVARKSIEYLLLSGRLSQKDFENLRDAEYCKQYLGCEFPLFAYDDQSIIDHNGKKRYWADPISLNGAEIYICSQWFENDRKRLVPWIKERL